MPRIFHRRPPATLIGLTPRHALIQIRDNSKQWPTVKVDNYAVQARFYVLTMTVKYDAPAATQLIQAFYHRRVGFRLLPWA